MTSKKTKYYALPLYTATDFIDPIRDLNTAMETVDTNLHNVSLLSSTAGTDANQALTTATSALQKAELALSESGSNSVMINGIKTWETKIDVSYNAFANNNMLQIYKTTEGDTDPETVDLSTHFQLLNIQEGDSLIVSLVGSSGVPFWAPDVTAFTADANYQLFDIVSHVLTTIDDYKVREIRVKQMPRYASL